MILLLIFCSFDVPGQGKIDSIRCYQNGQFVLDAAFGGIIAHNPPVKHLAQSHPRIVSLEYSVENHQAEWSKEFKFPKVGFALQYFDYQNPNLLGSSLAGLFFMEPRLNQRFTYRIGSGLVFNSNPFDLKTNTKNFMLGSRFAMVMHGQISYYQPVSQVFGLRFGLGITHFSNGAYTQPNSGINVFYASLGAVGWPEKQRISISTPEPPFLVDRRFSMEAFASFALVEKLPVGGPKYPVYQASVRPGYRLGRKSSIYAGLDFCYNEARAQLIREKPWFGKREGRLGFLLGHELHISKLSLLTDFGFYLIKPNDIDPWLYQRYGFRYRFSNPLSLLLLLKVHRSKAECLELGFGYLFFKSKTTKQP